METPRFPVTAYVGSEIFQKIHELSQKEALPLSRTVERLLQKGLSQEKKNGA